MTLSVWLYSQCFSLLALLLLEHYLLSILTLSNPAASGTLFAININLILSCSCWNIFYHQFLARLTLLLLGYYLPFIINLYSRVISEFWCFLIMNMTQKESGRALTFHYSSIEGGLNTYIHTENREYIVHCFFQCALK